MISMALSNIEYALYNALSSVAERSNSFAYQPLEFAKTFNEGCLVLQSKPGNIVQQVIAALS